MLASVSVVIVGFVDPLVFYPQSVGKWAVEQLKENKVSGDQGLVLKSRAKHHGISAMLEKPFVFENEPLIIQ